MKDIETLKIAMLKSVKQFGIDYPLVPPVLKATVHYGEIDDLLAICNQHGGAQDLATGTLHGTVEEKEFTAAALRKQMRKLARTAKVLDKTVYPTVASEMRMRGAKSYAQLLERGRAFVTALTDKTAVFIEHGAAPTVLADLTTAVAALESAINHKATALSTRVGSTAGLDAVTRAGVRVARKLDAIMSTAYADDPVRLAAWKSAQRIHRDRADSPAEPEGEGEGEPTPPVTPPAGS